MTAVTSAGRLQVRASPESLPARRLHIQPRKVMALVVAVVIGLILGVLARLVLPSRDPGGIFMAGLLGVAGSITGWMVSGSLGWYARGEELGAVFAVIGALAVLAIHRLVVFISR